MRKKKFTELISEKNQVNCMLSAPIYYLEGEDNSKAIENAIVYISRFSSSFYNSKSNLSIDFNKPISKF